MNCFQYHLDALKAGIEKAMPDVIVNRSLIDHTELRRDELLTGVITILMERINVQNDWTSSLRVLITGQLEVEPAAEQEQTGGLVEVAELALFSRLRAFLRNTGGLPHIDLEFVEFSAQSKVPYGWFVLRINYGPLNEASSDMLDEDIYPSNVIVSDMKGVNARIDIEPHEMRKEHEKWLDDDFSSSVPDAEVNIEYGVNDGSGKP
ncbi:hypothetical protein J3U75_07640 [Snodgrassella sp. B3088]|uniref:hypothetical protein n=1 Tax=Snodgrassella sp. B3088 TaxID=2818038 RepID=UPI00226A2912|nr:hypothetical protein [Snodgrassella sp. B3088]MCX8749254.1 hypothetical protein [Snodgrassella sp. B3088]